VAVATVVDNDDPLLLGRVQLNFPWYSDDSKSNWARVATLFAQGGAGTSFIPEVGDEVIVGFDHGNLEAPVVLGSVWNGKQRPPDPIRKLNFKREIVTKNGLKIILDDAQQNPTITISTNPSVPTNACSIVMDSQGNITIQGQTIKLQGMGVTATLANGKMDVS
jgi:uncharacterized protein involved in type VI secretion and phage assembly